MTDEPPMIGVGIPWYRRNDYSRILKVMIDSDNLSPTYDEWEKRAKHAERQYSARAKVYRVEIRPEKFVAWCAERGLNVDADARIKFASDPANWPMSKH